MNQPLQERFYWSLYRCRRVEEEIARVYPSDRILSPVHLSIGQEAVAVGACEALQADDVTFGTYRSHAMYLAKGGDLKKMIAELYGKADGCARGKGGSMHLIDVAAGVMGTSAVVGTTIPFAVGYALALQMRGERRVVASFFGDGAVEEGVFHESLNFAALKKLPLIFICENNGLAIHSRPSVRQAMNIPALVRAFGISCETVPDMDVFRIHERVSEAAAKIRAGQPGPYFFECHCSRWMEHVGPNEDFQAGYRSADEVQPWRAADQVSRVAALLDPATRNRIEQQVEIEVREAFAFAEQSPFPDERELLTDLHC